MKYNHATLISIYYSWNRTEIAREKSVKVSTPKAARDLPPDEEEEAT